MNIAEKIDSMIKWVGVEKILEGILKYIDEISQYNKEEYLNLLYNDISKTLSNYRNRYRDVDDET